MPFISSHRLWTRISRVSAVVLLAILLAGGFFYLKRTRSAGTIDTAKGPGASAADGSATQPQQPPVETPTSDKPVLPPLQPINPHKPGAAPEPKAGRPADGAHLTSIEAVAPAPAAPPANASQVLHDARAKLEAGDHAGVRALLNDGICNEKFTGVAGDHARALQAAANNQLLFTPAPVANDPYSRVARIENSGSLRAIARQYAVPWELVCRINGVSDRRIRVGQQLKTPVGPFHAVVWKQAFRMDIFLGGLPGEPGALYVTSLPVGLGKDDSTPSGLWSVVSGGKMKNPAWTNPRSGEHFEGYDPKNPLGGYWIALKGEEGNAVGQTSYGIHGTIEPETIGKQASMGCVRLKTEDVQLVYDMLVDGKSRVRVRE